VENPLLEVVKHADLYCLAEVGCEKVAHDTGDLSKPVESSANMAQGQFSLSFLGVGIVQHTIQVVIPPGVLLVRRDIIAKFVLWRLVQSTAMLLEMMLVTILWAICKPCCQNQFAMPEVAICTENVVIPAIRAGI